MGTISCPEIREVSLSPQERAEARDSYVRNFDRQFKDWSGIAKTCLDVKRDGDWKLLGFHSFDAWLVNAAPASQRYLYLAIDLYMRLSPDIPEEELSNMPIGSARVLREVSPSVRRDPKAREAAKKRPRELRKLIAKEFPDQHIENVASLQISSGINDLLEDARADYEVVSGHPATISSFIEFLVTEWLDGQFEDSGYSNRQRAQQLRVQ